LPCGLRVCTGEKSKSALHSKKNASSKVTEDDLSTDFGEFPNDIKIEYPYSVPVELADAFRCACQDAHVPPAQCPPLDSPRMSLRCSGNLDFDLKMGEDNDKGSSDCHSPQSSIDGAIQPQP
jgi:hypothetical protein